MPPMRFIGGILAIMLLGCETPRMDNHLRGVDPVGSTELARDTHVPAAPADESSRGQGTPSAEQGQRSEASSPRTFILSGGAECTQGKFIENLVNGIRGEGAQAHLELAIHTDNGEARAQLTLLKRQFDAPLFGRASSVSYARAHQGTTASSPGLHLALVEVCFTSCFDAVRAMQAIEALGRRNFDFKVLTVFRSLRRGRQLVLAYSETPQVRTVDQLLARMDALPPPAPCPTTPSSP